MAPTTQYSLTMLIRRNTDAGWECEGPEQRKTVYFTAKNLVEARKAALEVAWRNDYFVSSFVEIGIVPKSQES